MVFFFSFLNFHPHYSILKPNLSILLFFHVLISFCMKFIIHFLIFIILYKPMKFWGHFSMQELTCKTWRWKTQQISWVAFHGLIILKMTIFFLDSHNDHHFYFCTITHVLITIKRQSTLNIFILTTSWSAQFFLSWFGVYRCMISGKVLEHVLKIACENAMVRKILLVCIVIKGYMGSKIIIIEI